MDTSEHNEKMEDPCETHLEVLHSATVAPRDAAMRRSGQRSVLALFALCKRALITGQDSVTLMDVESINMHTYDVNGSSADLQVEFSARIAARLPSLAFVAQLR